MVWNAVVQGFLEIVHDRNKSTYLFANTPPSSLLTVNYVTHWSVF